MILPFSLDEIIFLYKASHSIKTFSSKSSITLISISSLESLLVSPMICFFVLLELICPMIGLLSNIFLQVIFIGLLKFWLVLVTILITSILSGIFFKSTNLLLNHWFKQLDESNPFAIAVNWTFL